MDKTPQTIHKSPSTLTVDLLTALLAPNIRLTSQWPLFRHYMQHVIEPETFQIDRNTSLFKQSTNILIILFPFFPSLSLSYVLTKSASLKH